MSELKLIAAYSYVPYSEADGDAKVVYEQLVGALLRVVEVHVDGVVEKVAGAACMIEEEQLKQTSHLLSTIL